MLKKDARDQADVSILKTMCQRLLKVCYKIKNHLINIIYVFVFGSSESNYIWLCIYVRMAPESDGAAIRMCSVLTTRDAVGHLFVNKETRIGALNMRRISF